MIAPGGNIAIKVPPHRRDEMVAFYRDRVDLDVKREGEETSPSPSDIWLELLSDDPGGALATLGSPQRDELEPLDGVEAHWTSDPAGNVLLVRRPVDREGPGG